MSTTAERFRSYWGERNIDADRLVALAVRYWQPALIVLLIGLAAGLRLWGLGDRALHHDESIHIKFAYDITKGVQYNHDPVYHGPVQYFGTALVFILFGDSDFTSRLLSVFFGIALVGLPFLLRKQIGTLGAYIAAGLLAVSPALLYFSRFVHADIYIAFFTLAMVVCIWRYLQERKEAWLIAIAPLMVMSFATKEVTAINVAILIVFLNVTLAADLVQQIRSTRTMTLLETTITYAIVIPTAWLIVATWPVTEGLRKRYALEEIPATGALLLVFGTLAAPQYAAAIQNFGIVEDKGYMAEGDIMRWTVLLLILGGAYVGVLWNWRVWLIAGVLFYGIFVLLFTSFFTNMPGFWTGIWGGMDYWLEQQGVRRGDQPDYYYLMILSVYEFLPLVFALGGALYYAFRGKVEQQLLTASALLLVIVFSVLPDDAPLVGDFRIQTAFVIAIGAVLLLSMDLFTKFLLFWMLSILFALTVAGEKMPWITVHLALPLALLGAKVMNDILSAPGLIAEPVEPKGRSAKAKRAEPPAILVWLTQPMVALGLAAALAVLAASLFQAFGPGSGISTLPWLLSAGAAGVVYWIARQISWRAAGQVAAVALFGALLVFTIRASGYASFDHGEANGTPPEILIYAQGSPGLNIIRDNIDDVAEKSGQGHDLKIIIDNTVNIWPWPWYLREYTNVEYNNFDSEFAPPAGSVVLISTTHQGEIQPFLDQYHEGIPYTHMWWFPEFYKGLELGDFLGDVFAGRLFDTWRGYFIDRTVPNASASPNMIAFFPREFEVRLPPPVQGVAGPAPQLPADSVTVIGAFGAQPGQFSQPADIAINAAGNVYVVDTLNHRVQVLSPDGTWNTFGTAGTGPGQFADPRDVNPDYAPDGPWGVGVDSSGNIFVADTWNHRVLLFDPNRQPVASWEIGDLFGPRDVAIDAEGNLLVVDTGNKRIMQYEPDGTLLRAFGGGGNGRAEFNEPSAISVAPDGDIYVADYWNKRIQHFDSSLNYIGEIKVDSWGSQGITDRAYIAALADGTVLATDPANKRIIVFDATGEEVAAWSLPSPTGTSRPVGVAVDGTGQVFISDGATSQLVVVPLEVLLQPAP